MGDSETPLPYEDGTFREGGLGGEQYGHLRKTTARDRASPRGNLPQTAGAQQADPPWSIGGGGSRLKGKLGE
mgnify:CR=1 FL=1